MTRKREQELGEENYRLVRANNELVDQLSTEQLLRQEERLSLLKQIDDMGIRNRAIDVRLDVLKNAGWCDWTLPERAEWVINGNVPPVSEVAINEGESIKGAIAKAEQDYRALGEHLINELWEEIEIRLGTLRRDSSIRTGRDRIQKLHIRLVNILRSASAEFGLPERIS